MTVKSVRVTKVQTELDLYASCHGVPTKWFPPIEVVHKGERTAVVLRLYRKKRGGTVHIETSPQSPHFAGLTVPVLASRRRYKSFISAAEDLIKASTMDPQRVGTKYPRSVWNTASKLYLHRKLNLEKVMAHLMELLDPERGRPFLAPPQTNIAPGTPLMRSGSRSVRKTGLLSALSKAQDTLGDLLPRMRDGRYMHGYTKEEREWLDREIRSLVARLKIVQGDVFNDTIVKAAPAKDVPRGGALDFLQPPVPSGEPVEDWSDIEGMLNPAPVAAPAKPLFDLDLNMFDDTPPQ
jgi:hypothetical protein